MVGDDVGACMILDLGMAIICRVAVCWYIFFLLEDYVGVCIGNN